jgi:hypothetical protein
MIPIDIDTNTFRRRSKISIMYVCLWVYLPFAMVAAWNTLRGPSGAEYDVCGMRNDLMKYW